MPRYCKAIVLALHIGTLAAITQGLTYDSASCTIDRTSVASCRCHPRSSVDTDRSDPHILMILSESAERVSKAKLPTDSRCTCKCSSGAVTSVVCNRNNIVVWNGKTCQDKGDERSGTQAELRGPRKRFPRGFRLRRIRIRIRTCRILGCSSHHHPPPPPPPDRTPPTFTYCPSVASVIYAPQNSYRTVVRWTSPTATDNKGSPTITQSPSHWKSGGWYTEGSYTITYTAVDSAGNKNSNCRVNFQVKVHKCLLAGFPNGHAHCDRHPVVFGTFCTFSCNTGYKLQGPANQMCGFYKGNTGLGLMAVSCKAYSCAVGQLLHGNIHCGQYPVLYGTRCTFTCLSGYTLQGPAIQTCGHYGTHTGLSAVACKEIKAGDDTGSVAHPTTSSPPLSDTWIIVLGISGAVVLVTAIITIYKCVRRHAIDNHVYPLRDDPPPYTSCTKF